MRTAFAAYPVVRWRPRYYTIFEDYTHVKFYRRSLQDVCVLGGARFDGFQHVDDWVPQRLVTATGPNPLPRWTGP